MDFNKVINKVSKSLDNATDTINQATQAVLELKRPKHNKAKITTISVIGALGIIVIAAGILAVYKKYKGCSCSLTRVHCDGKGKDCCQKEDQDCCQTKDHSDNTIAE